MVSALGAGDAQSFLAAFDPAMPGFANLRTDVEALAQNYFVQSAIVPVDSQGDTRRRSVELDWLLHLTSQNDAAQVTRRRQTIRCGLEKRGRRWKIVSLVPLSFFAPPAL